jgi:hypothetical protein
MQRSKFEMNERICGLHRALKFEIEQSLFYTREDPSMCYRGEMNNESHMLAV